MAFQLGVHDDKGQRRTMEDAYSFIVDFASVRGQGYFAVFDGHAGKYAAEWCGQHFHEVSASYYCLCHIRRQLRNRMHCCWPVTNAPILVEGSSSERCSRNVHDIGIMSLDLMRSPHNDIDAVLAPSIQRHNNLLLCSP